MISSVFGGLQKALQISCSEPHRISMYLRSAVEDPQMDEKASSSQPEGPSFRVVLHLELVHQKQKVPRWSIEEAEIKLIETISPITVATHTIVTATNTSIVRTQTRTVTFQEPKPAATLVSPVTQGPSLVEIHDLCQSICSMGTMQCGKCLGYMIAGQYRHGLYSPKVRLIDRTSLSVQSLADILDKRQCYKLTGADARRLAVPLA